MKEKKIATRTADVASVVNVQDLPQTPSVPDAPVALPPPPAPKLAELDKMALDLAKEKKNVAVAEAQTALAKKENAELAYRHMILQIYYRYGLSERDAIGEDGTILIGGAVQQGA